MGMAVAKVCHYGFLLEIIFSNMFHNGFPASERRQIEFAQKSRDY
jgi:hypothetical protein